MSSIAGHTFESTAAKAKDIAIKKKQTVEFDFNGRTVLVDGDTDLKLLLRDFYTSWTMDWTTIGPKCAEEYSPELKAQIKEREEENERKSAERAQREKEEKEMQAFNERVAGVRMEFGNEKEWKDYVEKNKDPYGACCVQYAENWAKLMQIEISKGATVAQCAKNTSHKLGFMGITGFMYGCAVAMLSACWKYGEDLRRWHNLDTQIGNEGEKANESGGVLNPALLNIG